MYSTDAANAANQRLMADRHARDPRKLAKARAVVLAAVEVGTLDPVALVAAIDEARQKAADA